MRRVLLVTLLLATACSGRSSSSPPAPTPVATSTAATRVPGSATTYPYPAEAGRISPLPVPPAFAGELARTTNNLTPAVRTATLTVTVPPGRALATDVICQGRGSVVVSTRPASEAGQTITCDGNPLPSQLGARAVGAVTTSTRYVVTLRATGPSRWLVAVSARSGQ